jgi:hypothetical protein
MSDVMLLGVLRMPVRPDSDPMTLHQFIGRARQAADRIEADAAEIERLRDVLAYAEAALADIGDADREPGDDVAWCEARAAEALPRVRDALRA